jgi:hypothetical protein
MRELEWRKTFGGERLIVGDVEFMLRPFGNVETASTPKLFVLRKTRMMAERLAHAVAVTKARRIVDIGIDQGGSTAYLAQVAEPEAILAIEYDTTPRDNLAAYVEAHGLRDVVQVHLGVDQADRDAVGRIVDGPVDLVIDDGSHELDRTRVTFETLWPRVRSGGIYVIEDWNWAERDIVGVPGPPLSALVHELVSARAEGSHDIEQLSIDGASVYITKT